MGFPRVPIWHPTEPQWGFAFILPAVNPTGRYGSCHGNSRVPVGSRDAHHNSLRRYGVNTKSCGERQVASFGRIRYVLFSREITASSREFPWTRIEVALLFTQVPRDPYALASSTASSCELPRYPSSWFCSLLLGLSPSPKSSPTEYRAEGAWKFMGCGCSGGYRGSLLLSFQVIP